MQRPEPTLNRAQPEFINRLCEHATLSRINWNATSTSGVCHFNSLDESYRFFERDVGSQLPPAPTEFNPWGTLNAETPTTYARKEVVRHLTFCWTLLSHALKCRKRCVVNTSSFAVTRSMCRPSDINDHEASSREIKRRRKMNSRVETQNGMASTHTWQT